MSKEKPQSQPEPPPEDLDQPSEPIILTDEQRHELHQILAQTPAGQATTDQFVGDQKVLGFSPEVWKKPFTNWDDDTKEIKKRSK